MDDFDGRLSGEFPTGTSPFSIRDSFLATNEYVMSIAFQKPSEEHTMKKFFSSQNLCWLESEPSSELEQDKAVVLRQLFRI